MGGFRVEGDSGGAGRHRVTRARARPSAAALALAVLALVACYSAVVTMRPAGDL
jgi:hypothetical protein